MEIYLVQHGLAYAENENPTRPLTELGIQQTQKIASWFKNLKPELEFIIHSPKRRAQQTAEIFAENLGPTVKLKVVQNVLAQDPIQNFIPDLDHYKKPIMLVSHQPFLAKLCGFLTTGSEEKQPLSFYNSGIICLKKNDFLWQINWAVIPDLILSI